jgi:magnesium-transporting ATPase (P-type)
MSSPAKQEVENNESNSENAGKEAERETACSSCPAAPEIPHEEPNPETWISQVRVTEDIINPKGELNTSLSNVISTTKYTKLNWLPKSLFEQFRRFANILFVSATFLMIIGQYFPMLFETPLNPWSTAGVLFLVMMVTSIKEGLEDSERSRRDAEDNGRSVTLLRWDAQCKPQEIKVRSSEVVAGDIVKLEGKCSCPADLLLIYTSTYDHGNMCYIETANIDGETNLKVREAPPLLLSHVQSGELKQEYFKGHVEFELPNKNMHNFAGALHLDLLKDRPLPLCTENMILRGSVFSNTDWAYGVVIYVGQETKIQMNNVLADTKLGKIEEYANHAVIILLIAQAALATVSVISIYAFGFSKLKDFPYIYPDKGAGESVLPLWLEYWFIFYLLYINFIPISIYVTIEMTNLGQAYLIQSDKEMYCDEVNSPCIVKSSSLVQEPGVVSHIFSDKTGTLTKNEMKFLKFVIRNMAQDVILEGEPNPNVELMRNEETITKARRFSAARSTREDLATATAGSAGSADALPTPPGGGNSPAHPPMPGADLMKTLESLSESPVNLAITGQGQSGRVPSGANAAGHLSARSERPGDHNGNHSHNPFRRHPHVTEAFFRCLATCHTVVRDREGNYRSESPDELALIEGIAGYECGLKERGASSMEVNLFGRAEHFDILAVNAFNASRKRMSVLLKQQSTGRFYVMVKGADSIMLPLCKLNPVQRSNADKSLLDLAYLGLRTLCVAQRELNQREVTAWLETYHKASSSIQNRSEYLDRVAAVLECNLELLGITAIEDKLQDEVPEVIADLAKAGIVLWMLTGDKEETAVQIAHSCNLLTKGTKLFNLTKLENAEDFKATLNNIYEEVVKLHVEEEKHELTVRTGRLPTMQDVQDIAHNIIGHGVKRVRDREGVYQSGVNRLVNMLSGNSQHTKSAKYAAEDPEMGTIDPSGELADGNLLSSVEAPTNSQVAVVMDGPSMRFFDQEDKDQREKLVFIGQACRSVVACRLTPIQKQQLVGLVKKDARPRAVTLAIGDGANDVSMIREADLGVGIIGKEGCQAANNSDFAMGQFKFLRRLTLLHGRWNYMRQSKVFLYSVHKNICLVVTLFWYSYLSAVSAQSMYESWVYSGFNVFLFLPIIAFGVMDRDVSEEFALAHPSLYGCGKQNTMLSSRRIALWMINAVFYGVVISLLSFVTLQRTFMYYDLYSMGCFIFIGMVNALQLKIAFMHNQWNYLNMIAMILSTILLMGGLWLLDLIGDDVGMTNHPPPHFNGTITHLYGQKSFWLFGFFMTPLVCIMIDLSMCGIRYFFVPVYEMISAEVENKEMIQDEIDYWDKVFHDGSSPIREVVRSVTFFYSPFFLCFFLFPFLSFFLSFSL